MDAPIDMAREMAVELMSGHLLSDGQPLGLILTDRCNLRCSYCLRSKKQRDLPTDLVLGLLPQAKELGCTRISLSGGEAFLHPDFETIIREIVRLDFKFSVISNGYDFRQYDFLLKYRRNLECLDFSLDAAGKEKHDINRGEGSYNRVLDAVRHFTPQVKVTLTCVLNKHNLDQIEDLVRLAEDMGIHRLNFASVITSHDSDPLALNDQEARYCLARIEAASARTAGMAITPAASLVAEHIVGFCKSLHKPAPTFMPDGKVSFCCDLVGDGFTIGSLHGDSLQTIMQNSQKLAGKLLEKRRAFFENGHFYDRFDSCTFCNKALGLI